MLELPYLKMTLAVLSVALACAAIQKFFKKYLESDQYYYLKDITLIGVWALYGIWTPDTPLRITIAAAVISGCIGFCQKVTNGKSLRFLYFLVAFAFAVFGPRIAFIEASDGEFIYLSNITSLFISTLWVGIMPIFFQEVDEIPGMCGVLLVAIWGLMSAVIFTSPQQLQDVTQICITGIVFLLVFGNRHIHAYRRLTEPLTAFWGTLVAGVLIFAISRGIATYSLISVTAGILIIPAFEIAASVISALFFTHPTGNLILYRKFIAHGINHATAVHGFISICAAVSCLIACVMLKNSTFFAVVGVLLALFIITGIIFRLGTAKTVKLERNPSLWGINVDNISLNYALSQVQHWIKIERKPHLIITPDALAALRSRTDKRYSDAYLKAGLVLPDGAGLIAAFKFLGTPIQERIPGCEFVEHLCERAAIDGWKVYFFGGKAGVAESAADVMQKKFDGLKVVGCKNGYFKEDETDAICDEIKSTGADILFLGLGVPKQEYWLADNLEKTGSIVGMGIGGSMDVISGNLKRAPKIWQKLKLEWLYRTIQEPWRWKRLLGLPVFVFHVILTKLHLDNYK